MGKAPETGNHLTVAFGIIEEVGEQRLLLLVGGGAALGDCSPMKARALSNSAWTVSKGGTSPSHSSRVGTPPLRRLYRAGEIWIVRATGVMFIGFAVATLWQALRPA